MENRENSSPPLGMERPGESNPSSHGAGAGAEAKAAVERELHDAKDRLSAAGSTLRSEASGAAGTISNMVSEQAEKHKHEAADSLKSFADSVRRAADELGASDNSMPARLVEGAAHGLEQLSSSLQSRSVSDMTRSVTAFGRENPTAFLAGCLLAGIAVGRFMIASSARPHSERRDAAEDEWRGGGRSATGAEGQWPGAGRNEYPGTTGGPGAGTSAGMGVAGSAAAGAGGTGAGTSDLARAGIPGAGLANAGLAGGTSGQAGTFGAGVSSAERAPGDLDAQGTMMDDPEPTLPSDTGLGERPGGLAGEGDTGVPKPFADMGVGKGGRNGDF